MIRVLVNFGGRITNERRILPGEYADDDPCLFGIAEYLVTNGHAVRIEEPVDSGTFYVREQPDDEEFIYVDVQDVRDPRNAHDWKAEPAVEEVKAEDDEPILRDASADEKRSEGRQRRNNRR